MQAMARTRAPIPAALAHTAFTSQEAYAQAVTRDQLRGPSYQQLHRGIYAPTEHSPTSWDYARIVTHACPTAALSQISAALLWGFPLPTRFLAQDPPHQLRNWRVSKTLTRPYPKNSMAFRTLFTPTITAPPRSHVPSGGSIFWQATMSLLWSPSRFVRA